MAEQELIDFLVAQGHSKERALQIASNHPEAVRTDLQASKANTLAPTAATTEPQESDEPMDLGAFLKDEFQKVFDAIKSLDDRHERLVDHVNREIGVSGDAPLVARVRDLESKGVSRAQQKEAPQGEAPATQPTSSAEQQGTVPPTETP